MSKDGASKNTDFLKLRIAHLSDTHSRMEPHRRSVQDACDHGIRSCVNFGGYPLMISAMLNAREDAENSKLNFLALHSGDSFQGSLHFNLSKGKLNAELLNLMKLDAMAIGNHEFDLGPAPFADFCQIANFRIVASNLKIGRNAHPKLHRIRKSEAFITSTSGLPAAIRTMDDGTQVALLGVTLQNLSDLADTGPGVFVEPPVEYTYSIVQKIQAQGIRHIIILSHLGLEQDKELARDVPGISAIFGGHTHHLQGSQDSFGFTKSSDCGLLENGVPIFHCGENAQHFGLYDLTLDSKGRTRQVTGETIAPVDSSALPLEVGDWLKNRSDVLLTIPSEVALKKIASTLPTTRIKRFAPMSLPNDVHHVRVPFGSQQSALAPLIATAIYESSETAGINPEIALVNAGVIRSGIMAGVYENSSEIWHKIIPFDLDIVAINVPGEVLRAVIDRVSLEAKSTAKSGRYPYFYPPEYLSSDFVEGKFHRLITTSYIAKGKDGYSEFRNLSDSHQPCKLNLKELCQSYFSAKFPLND